MNVLNLFVRNYAITCLETLLVINSYFDVRFEKLKRVLHVLPKETLISDLKKHMSCTYDSGILMFVLSVQYEQVQPQKGESIDRAHQPEIWRCMYARDGADHGRRRDDKKKFTTREIVGAIGQQ